jgi:hypothetical protein
MVRVNKSPLGNLGEQDDAGVRSERLSLDREAVNRLGVNFRVDVTGEKCRLRINHADEWLGIKDCPGVVRQAVGQCGGQRSPRRPTKGSTRQRISP